MTTAELEQTFKDWIATARHLKTGKLNKLTFKLGPVQLAEVDKKAAEVAAVEVND